MGHTGEHPDEQDGAAPPRPGHFAVPCGTLAMAAVVLPCVAGNQQVVQAPAEVTTYGWDSENRLREIALPSGVRNTMLYRADGLRFQFWDEEGDKRMVWDSQGTSGYQDLLQERLP